jgi:hypothetical protein
MEVQPGEKLSQIGIRKCNIFLFSDNETGEGFWKAVGWRERIDLKVLQKPTTIPKISSSATTHI